MFCVSLFFLSLSFRLSNGFHFEIKHKEIIQLCATSIGITWNWLISLVWHQKHSVYLSLSLGLYPKASLNEFICECKKLKKKIRRFPNGAQQRRMSLVENGCQSKYFWMCHSEQTHIHVPFVLELCLSLKFPPDFALNLRKCVRSTMKPPPAPVSFSRFYITKPVYVRLKLLNLMWQW